jgi:RNA polymerase sigma-70 factor (ECF subfamily)
MNNTEFQTLYEQSSERLFRIVLRMVRSREEAEDLLHDIYIKAYENRQRFDESLGNMEAWLTRMTINHTLNHIKRKKWWNLNLERIVYHTETEVPDVAEVAEESLAQKALQKVQAEYKACIVLKDLEGYDYAEIATMLKIPVGTVRSRLNRGRAQLEKFYKNEVKAHEKI